ncbi:hypothetical protein ACTOB_001792 [Actinoplanes oblitus]|uniref:Uncharacterized protein n=1 Tax=Actinoplanes oblitus TaxID=3040509 RepID=A0ABY8WPG4_9ACTN|nr:hypothetical protein [Actinoplanes oblitus]WIM98204.1 hypothetical protein ACTOB_001792 [Actinoplanes oblitus]
MIDGNRLGPVLPRFRVRDDGLLLRPRLRRPILISWTKLNGVRIAPADGWSGRNASPGSRGYYALQVKLAGEWRRLGGRHRVHHAVLPLAVREAALGERNAPPPDEQALHTAYEMIRTRWEQAGGTPGDEDDNWPRPPSSSRPPPGRSHDRS